MFENLLVPLDGSDNSETVLSYVTAFAGAFTKEIALLVVTELGAPRESHIFNSYLEKLAATLDQRIHKPGLTISTSIIVGNPPEEILKYAQKVKSDLIIIASHGASGGNPLRLGHVALRILSDSKKPVLLVGHTPDEHNTKSGLIKRIMVPLDGSDMSRTALEIVEPMASVMGSETVLFQAVEPVRYVPGIETMGPGIVLPSDDELKQSAAKYLAEVEKPLKQRGLPTSTVIIADSPAEAILNYAEAGDIDIIAMTTHGVSGIKRWVFGSTTEKVLQASVKPVLVIRSKKP
jgi:nucleotide-binding universal stress UspA family protein